MFNKEAEIQNIKFILKSMEVQFEDIKMQSRNNFNSIINSQIANLGLNIINNGIQILLM